MPVRLLFLIHSAACELYTYVLDTFVCWAVVSIRIVEYKHKNVSDHINYFIFCNPCTNEKKTFIFRRQIPTKASYKMQNLIIRYFEMYTLKKYIVVIITRVPNFKTTRVKVLAVNFSHPHTHTYTHKLHFISRYR